MVAPFVVRTEGSALSEYGQKCANVGDTICVYPSRPEELTMDETFFEQFVARFQAAWDRREGQAFQTLWHPAGRLYYPPLGGWISGNRIDELNELNSAILPDLPGRPSPGQGAAHACSC